MNSVFSNESVCDIQVKRTRSGRAVIPPLAGWTGERIVSSLDDAAPPQYVTPTLDARAQYLLSSSMLERLKKQKLIQEPCQVEAQNFPVAPASDHSGRSVSRQKQKSLGTVFRKSIAHKTKKVGLSKSHSKLVCVELPESPEKKRMKMTVHCQMSDMVDYSDIHEMKKHLQNLSHNYPDSSGYHKRKGFYERALVDGKKCTGTRNHAKDQNYKENKSYVHQDSSEASNVVNNKAVLPDQNHNLILPSNAKNSRLSDECTSHSGSCEADDECSYEGDKGINYGDSVNHFENRVHQRVSVSSKNEKAKNASQHDEISELADYSQTTNMQTCIHVRIQEGYDGNKATDKHDKPSLNARSKKEHLSDDAFKKTNKITSHVLNTKSAADVSPKPNPFRKQGYSKMKVHHSEHHSGKIKMREDSLRETKRHGKSLSGVSKNHADVDDGMFPKTDVKMTAAGRNDKPGRLERIVRSDQQGTFHSYDSSSLSEGEDNFDYGSQIETQKSPMKAGSSFQSKSMGCSSVATGVSKGYMKDLPKEKHATEGLIDKNVTGVSKGYMKDLPKEKHATEGLIDKNVIYPGLKCVHSSKDKRVVYYALDHSITGDVPALNEVKKNQNNQKRTIVSHKESINQQISPQKYGALATYYPSENSGSVTKASKHIQLCDFKSNPMPSVNIKLQLESSRRHSSGGHDNMKEHSEQVVMHKKRSGFPHLCDSWKLSQHNNCASSDDDFDQSRADHSKNKTPICGSRIANKTLAKNLCRQSSLHTDEEESDESGNRSMSDVAEEEPNQYAVGIQNSNKSSVCGSHIVNKTPIKNLHGQLDSVHTHEEELDDGETSDRSMSDMTEEKPSQRAAGIQNCHVSMQRNSNLKSSVKSSVTLPPKKSEKDFSRIPPRDVDMSSNHETCSLEKGLSQSNDSEQNCRLPHLKFGNKCVSLKEKVVRRQSHIAENRPKSGVSKKFLFNPMRSQLTVSNIGSISSANSLRNKQTNGDECSQKKRSNPRPGEVPQQSTKNIDCIVGNSKKSKPESFGRQNVSLSSQATCGSEAEFFSKSSQPLAVDSCSECSQSSTDEVRGSARNSVMGDDKHDTNQHVSNTYTLPCRDERENSGENQISNRSLSRHHQLDSNNSGYKENSGKNKLKALSSSAYDITQPQNCGVLETVDSSSQKSVKKHYFRHHCRQKSGDSRKDHDSISLPCEISSDCNCAFSHTSNFDHSHSQKKKDLSKKIPLHCSTEESDILNYVNTSTSVTMKLPPRPSETNNLSPEKHKDFRPNSVIESGLVAKSNVLNGLRDGASKKYMQENFATNIPSSANVISFDQGANKNAVYNAFKSKNSKKKVVDSNELMRKKLETAKNSPSDFQKAHTRCSSSTMRERCVHKHYTYTKGDESVVTYNNTPVMQASSNKSAKLQDCSNYQKMGKMKNSQSSSPSDSCFNSEDLESSSGEASASCHSFSEDDDCTLNREKFLSNCSSGGGPQGNILHQNVTFTNLLGEYHQGVFSQDHENKSSLGTNSELRVDRDAELNVGSNTNKCRHSKNKSDTLGKTSKKVSTNADCEQKMDDSQKSPAAMMKLETRESARTGSLKKRKAVYRLHTQYNEDDQFDNRKSDASEGVVLQLERYSEVESESRTSSPSLEFSPSHGSKTLHSKKQSSHRADIRRNEIDTHLLGEEQTRPKKHMEQNVSNDLGAVRRTDHSTKSGKSNNVLIITELQKDENIDFRISKEDMQNYCFSDEDSDIVYTNY